MAKSEPTNQYTCKTLRKAARVGEGQPPIEECSWDVSFTCHMSQQRGRFVAGPVPQYAGVWQLKVLFMLEVGPPCKQRGVW